MLSRLFVSLKSVVVFVSVPQRLAGSLSDGWYCHGNGEVQASLFNLISPLVFSITARRAACDREPCGSRALSTGHRYYREL